MNPVASAAQRLRRRYRPDEAYLSFSQEGEDMVLRRMRPADPPGFYVDVGAHHPERFSNTSWYYRHGWHGINIEADPALLAAFERERPRDVNLNCGVGATEGELELHVFNEPAINTFDAELAAERERESAELHVVERRTVPVRRLASILDEHLPPGTSIDFLTVDVEGRDLDVLQSNDWARYRPTYVLAESHGNTVASVASDPIAQFLAGHGYTAIAKTFSTLVFVADAPA